MKDEKLKVENIGDVKLPRRQVLKGAAAVTVGLLYGDLVAGISLNAEAADFGDFAKANLDETNGLSYDQIYQTFVNDFATGEFISDRNPYIKIEMGNVQQFTVRDTINNKAFILDYYKDCIKNKKHADLSTYYPDAEQADFLKKCEDYLYYLSLNPNDTAVATEFLNCVKDKMLITTTTPEGDYAAFDPYYLKYVPVYETVCEMVQAAWENIPAIDYLRQNTKPENMGDTENHWCAQVIIDYLCGRSDKSYIDSAHLRHSGITKGNKQLWLLIRLNKKYPSYGMKYMVMESLVDLRSKDKMCSLLDMTSAEYDEIARKIRKSRENGLLDEENGRSVTITTKFGVMMVPFGSTIADVMKSFHADIVKQITGVKINDEVVSFDTILTGDNNIDFITNSRFSENTEENLIKFYNAVDMIEAERIDGVAHRKKDSVRSLSLVKTA